MFFHQVLHQFSLSVNADVSCDTFLYPSAELTIVLCSWLTAESVIRAETETAVETNNVIIADCTGGSGNPAEEPTMLNLTKRSYP